MVIRTDSSSSDSVESGEEETKDILQEDYLTLHPMQERWSQQVSRFKKEWQGFWRDQIDKARQKKIMSGHAERMDGGRWLYGAGDIYRLSHLLGNSFDLRMADYLAVHYQTYSLTLSFLLSPPDDCFVLQICPDQPLKSAALLSKKEALLFDYQQGVDAGERFIQEYQTTLALSPPDTPCKFIED